jgi:hypothetical protein
MLHDDTCAHVLVYPTKMLSTENGLSRSLSPRDKKWPLPFWDPDWRARHEKECRWWNKTAPIAVPPLWQLVARKTKQELNYVTLKLPESKGEYPEEWGYEPFPEQRGKFSTRFQEWLKEDMPDIWTDPESAEDPGSNCFL